jgi:small ligand-binding sensory domain FIST
VGATGHGSPLFRATPRIPKKHSAATGVRGSIGSTEIFAEGTAHTATKLGVHLPGLARYRQGVVRGGRLAGRPVVVAAPAFLTEDAYPQ